MKQLKYHERSNSTLLEDYIAQKKRGYIPPEREGVPKGELIGFSGEKYYANLLLLKSGNLKTTAMRAGVSYGLLRKWRMDDKWHKCNAEHCQEYTNRFLRNVNTRAEKAKEKVDSMLRYSRETVLRPAPIHKHPEYADFSKYNELLLFDIFKELRCKLEEILLSTRVLKKSSKKDPNAESSYTLNCLLQRLIKDKIRDIPIKRKRGEDRSDCSLLIKKYFEGIEIIDTLELISYSLQPDPRVYPSEVWHIIEPITKEMKEALSNDLVTLKNKLMLRVGLFLVTENNEYTEGENHQLGAYILSQAFLV